MDSIIFVSIGFFVGFLFAYLFFRSKKTSIYESFILDFKKTIDDFKIENKMNSKEIKIALDNQSNLAKVLTTNQNLKGRFGEDCLENIIKTVYPNENIDYFKQFITKNSENKQIKPDYVINLPNNKAILIDCKLNLEKFVEYKENINTDFEITKKKELILDLNSTINDLSNKKYQTSSDFCQPDFIFMYIPLEPLISLIYTDNDFVSVIKSAYDKNIIIVGNSGILTSIRLVKNIWSNQIQNQNVDNIINIAQIIYNLVAQHSKNLLDLKNQVLDFSKNFEKEFNNFSLENKIFKSAELLKDYGINPLNKKNGKKITTTEIEKEFLK